MQIDVNTHLGNRLRRRRRLLGLTQHQLATNIGIRFQQIQKYECGANRMSAARLWQLADALDVPVSYFYDGLGRETQFGRREAEDLVERRETRNLLDVYQRLQDRPRLEFLEFAKGLLEEGEGA